MVWRLHRIVGISAAVVGAVIIAFCIWAIAPLAKAPTVLPPTRVLFADGSLMYEVLPSEGDRQQPVELADLPPSVTGAIVAAEDERFFQHRGVDIPALVRAAGQNIRAREVVSGASTIEEQVVKNAYFPHARRGVIQKLREAVAATAWAMTHSKQETLETYLNVVPFGGGLRGIGAASRAYFRVDAKELNVPQAAMLAGVIAAPSAYDPFLHTREARERQSFVLDRMVALGSLSAAERVSLEDVTVPVFDSSHPIRAPHAVFRILSNLEQTIPQIRDGGYVIQTTLDASLQSTIESTITRRLDALKDQHVTNAAAVAMDPQSGKVLAYVGSADYFDEGAHGKVDMAAAKRQPGSALKPFLYLLAFMRGMPASAPLADVPVRYVSADGQPYYPRNYDYRFRGVVSARDALGSSLNVPAVNLLDHVGLHDFFEFLSAFGIDFPEAPEHYGLGVVLGGGEVTLMDATNAYAALARGGRFADAQLVERVTNANGHVVWQSDRIQPTSVSSEKNLPLGTQLVTDVLSDQTARTMAFGENNALNIGKRIAVKTGTTRDFRDNWAFGYTPNFVLGIWVGNADNSPMKGISGMTGAVPLWADVMRARDREEDLATWEHLDAGLTTRDVCVPSGLRATDLCPKRRQELFIVGSEPSADDSWFVRCSNGRVGFEPPPIYRVGAIDAGCGGTSLAPARILSPLDGDAFTRDALIDEGAQGIPFLSSKSGQASYLWQLDGQRIESSANPYLWKPVPGTHELILEDATGTIRFTVE